MTIFFELFSPNNRHRTEELRRLENTREEEAQGEPGRGPIDLNSGTVLIRMPNQTPGKPQDDSAPEDDVDAAAPGQEDDGA